MGLVYRPPSAARRRPARRLGPLAPGWLGWLALACAWLLVIAVLRDGGSTAVRPVAVPQLILTAALILALALLLELGSSGFGPAADDNASGTGVALALVRALDVSPPQQLAVELVLTGAGDGASWD